MPLPGSDIDTEYTIKKLGARYNNNMKSKWDHVKGIVIRGHRVASGPSQDYPYGTIEKQKPYFKKMGLDLDGYYSGTLNISIAPGTFEIINPEFTFDKVEWTDLHPPETFSFSRCRIIYRGVRYSGWVYYPHPETKKKHYQDKSMIEVITAEIPSIHYGEHVELGLNIREIQIHIEDADFRQ